MVYIILIRTFSFSNLFICYAWVGTKVVQLNVNNKTYA